MWVDVIIIGVIAIFIGWMIREVVYWADYPMDHSNLIPMAIMVIALGIFLALL